MATRVRLLEADPGLGASLDPESRRRATAELEASAEVLDPGPWEAPHHAPEPGHLGLLVIEGMMTRDLEVAGARCVELLCDGDLLRPWQEDSASFLAARWRVLKPTTLALLAPDLASRLCAYPELVEALVARATQRARSLAAFSAIDNVVGVENRLRLLLWHLAERWGRVENDGVVMPLQLTHQMLADLVGSRRPSVTTALRRLVAEGVVSEQEGGGWRLAGAPPDPSGA